MAKGIKGSSPPCSVDGCGRTSEKRGWCPSHYRFWRKYGDPTKQLRIRNSGTVEERWWARVDKNGPIPEQHPELGPCWLWTGYINIYGYGQFSAAAGQSGRAHRWGYEWFVGPIPEGLVPDHICGVRHCVKVIADEHGPAHLEAVTQAENVHRSKATKWLGAICSEDGCSRKIHGLGLCKRHYELATRKRKPCQRCGGPKEPGERRHLCIACKGS